MNIYVIYKFKDYDLVKRTIGEIQKAISDSHKIFMFEPDKKPLFWRCHARKKLKESQLVLLFDSLSGGKSEVGRHISWEVEYAAKQDKKIVIFETTPTSHDRAWYQKDYSEQGQLAPKYKTMPLSNAVAFMQKECDWSPDKSLLHAPSPKDLTSEEMSILLEQYRIMVDTSEKLMERRQATTNLYTTLSTTLLALIGASFGFDNLWMCSAILFVSGVILIPLCRNWELSLETFDLNNTGKFAVINLLETYLPAEIFECEYRYNKQKGMRSFSAREKKLPKIFALLGILLIIGSVILFALLMLSSWGMIPTDFLQKA